MSNDLSKLPLLSELHWISSMHSKDYVLTSARSEYYWNDGNTNDVESKKGWQSDEWIRNEEYE